MLGRSYRVPLIMLPAIALVGHIRLADNLVQTTTGTTALPEHILIIIPANSQQDIQQQAELSGGKVNMSIVCIVLQPLERFDRNPAIIYDHITQNTKTC